jgi:GNAT superfamily N-acetyltransferase
MKVSASDKKQIVDILAGAFVSNKSVNYIVRQDRQKQQRIRALMKYSVDICSLFGKVWLTEDQTACALLLYPDQKKTTFRSVFLDLRLMVRCIGFRNIRKVPGREKLVHAIQPKGRNAYLWFVGVHLSHQHTGKGSALLKQIIADCDLQQRPVYLETSTLENLPWYERFGFVVYHEADFGYSLFFLQRPLSDL